MGGWGGCRRRRLAGGGGAERKRVRERERGAGKEKLTGRRAHSPCDRRSGETPQTTDRPTDPVVCSSRGWRLILSLTYPQRFDVRCEEAWNRGSMALALADHRGGMAEAGDILGFRGSQLQEDSFTQHRTGRVESGTESGSRSGRGRGRRRRRGRRVGAEHPLRAESGWWLGGVPGREGVWWRFSLSLSPLSFSLSRNLALALALALAPSPETLSEMLLFHAAPSVTDYSCSLETSADSVAQAAPHLN